MASPKSLVSNQRQAMSSTTVTEGSEYEDAEANYQPKTLKFWLIMMGMYASIFLVALDRMIIATAIPAITNEFHSIEDIGWWGSAYMLTAAVFNPFFGRIYQVYSTKWVFLVAIFIFEVGSALCGAAPNSAAFTVGRAIAGIGAAGIFSGGQMIILPLVPLRKRPIFTSLFGMAFGISSVIGPLIGGSFSDNQNLTWRWCFYINLPIGGFTFVAILLLLHIDSPPRQKLTILAQLKRLDPVGLLFLAASMVCLIIALQWGGSIYSWSAPRIIGLLVTFAVLFVAFLAVEVLTPETSMAPARVILNRSVAGSMLFMFLLSGAMMAVVYYLAIWFQAAQAQSAMDAGIRTIPLLLSLVIMGILGAVFTQKIGYYVPSMLLSPCLSAVGCGMLSTLTPSAGRGKWIGFQVIYGFGIGSGFQTCYLAPQTVLPRADVPLGMALMSFMQQLGGSVFLAVGQNIFSRQLVANLSDIEGVDAETVINVGATAYRELVPLDRVETVTDAYSYALTRVFILAAALSACQILGAGVLEWRSIKGTKKQNLEVDEANEKGKDTTDGTNGSLDVNKSNQEDGRSIHDEKKVSS